MSDYARNKARDLIYDAIEHCMRHGVSAADFKNMAQTAWEETAKEIGKEAAKEFA